MHRPALIILWLYIPALAYGIPPGKEYAIETPEGESNTNDVLYTLTANGKNIYIEQYKTCQYAQFTAESAVRIALESKDSIQTLDISPKAMHIIAGIEGKTGKFVLPKPGYYVIRINKKTRLFLFVEQPEENKTRSYSNILSYGVDNTGQEIETKKIQQAIRIVSGTGKVLFFPPGTYVTGSLTIPSNTKIYLSAGAILKGAGDIALFKYDVKPRGFILIRDAQGVEITGRGIIDGNGRNLRNSFGDEARMRLIAILNSKQVTLEGIMVRDPGSWNTQILMSEDVTIRNVKMLNDVELSNTDGFDPDASKRVLIDHCFAYCGDDNVAVKTTQTSGYVQDVEDITVRGCVFLTRKSSLKVGTESRGSVMKNILFEDNDVIESDRGMALYCSDGATFENIRFINNRFEDNYPDAKRCGIHFTISKRNPGSRAGAMSKVLIKDCRFDKPFPNASEILGFDTTHRIDVTIENLVIGGKVCRNTGDARIETNAFADVIFR